VKRLEDFDNSLIELIAGTAEFKKIPKSHEKRAGASYSKVSGEGIKKSSVPA
jgi:hypothetical protein